MASLLPILRASRPQFRNDNGQDRIAFAVHAAFLAAGYRLVAAGAAAEEEAPKDINAEQDVGLDGWRDLGDRYAFRYLGDGALARRVIVKCLSVGSQLMIDAEALDVGDRHPTSHATVVPADYMGDQGSSDYGAQFKNFEGLATLLNAQIIAPLTEQGPGDFGRLLAEQQQQQSHRAEGPRQGVVVDEETGHPSVLLDEDAEYPRFYPPPGTGGLNVPPIPPYGYDDLNPLGGAGVLPPRQPGMGGGMLLGPHDPRWGGMGGGEYFRPPGGGIPPGVPPGARFDPFGPPGVPGFEPGRFMGGGSRRPPGGGPPTHPDLEHFPPF